jgi:hypothetical protein
LRYRFGDIAIVATWLLALLAELVLSPKRESPSSSPPRARPDEEQERRLALS